MAYSPARGPKMYEASLLTGTAIKQTWIKVFHPTYVSPNLMFACSPHLNQFHFTTSEKVKCNSN